MLRMNRRIPSRASSRDTLRLTAAGVTPAALAAAVKLLSSAARQNISMLPSCRSSKWRVMEAPGERPRQRPWQRAPDYPRPSTSMMRCPMY
ncbi:hypothetical protein D3C85_1577510 [compost metagenome]